VAAYIANKGLYRLARGEAHPVSRS